MTAMNLMTIPWIRALLIKALYGASRHLFGEKELSSDTLPVRDRSAGKQIRNMKLQELTTEIAEKTGDKPFKPLTLPKLLSKRPQFAF